MIFTDRTITVQKGTSSLDETVVLYRGDKEVEIRFTLNEKVPFKFGSGTDSNIIEKAEAAYGQLVIKTPNDLPSIFSEIVPTNEGKIIFTITAEMIDEITEVGNYTFQIRLFDESRNSRATIPEVVNGIEIREPIATEDVTDTNEVGVATVGYALTTAGTTEDAFDSQGNYNKTTWGTGDRITAAKLNKIEAGIDGVNQKVASGGEGSTVTTASNITINDTAGNYEAKNVEDALAEAGSQIKVIAKDVLLEDGKLYLKKEDGTKIGTGVILPVSGSITWENVTGKPATFTPSSHKHSKSEITDFPTIPTKTSELNNDSGFLTSHQDITGKVDKVDGKGLSTNDLTTTLKQNYDNAYTHSQSTHAPSDAQKNSDITKEEIEAKLTGEITTHSHPNSSVVGSEFKKVIETTFGQECYAFTVTQDKDGNPIQLKEGIIRVTTAQPLQTSSNLNYAVGFVEWVKSYNNKGAIYMLNAMKNYEFYASSIYFKVINQRVLAINLGQVRCGTSKPTIGYDEIASAGKVCGMTSFRLINKDYIDRITVGFDMVTTGLFSEDSLLEVWAI